jgi:hypothetical protein
MPPSGSDPASHLNWPIREELLIQTFQSHRRFCLKIKEYLWHW